MRASVIGRFGPPEVLQLRHVARPVPARDQILVRVIAAGLNPVDAQVRSDGAAAGIALPATLGCDAAGVVCALGEDVTDFAVGDGVFYFTDFLGNEAGSYAEYQVVDAGIVARRPVSLSYGQASALPLAGGTAYELVHRRLRIEAGEWLVVFGAGGGVGTYVVQLAASAGARVIAIASEGKHERLRQLGAVLTLDYRTADVRTAILAHAGEVDALADLVGGSVIERSLPLVREHGRVASICALSGDFEAAVDRNITVHGILVRPEAARLRAIARLVDAGVLYPIVSDEVSLGELTRAHRDLEDGHTFGKVVLRVHPEPAEPRRLRDGAALDHVGVTVTNLERGVRFYRDLLGLRVSESGQTDGPELDALLDMNGARVATADLDAGDGRLVELVEYLRRPEEADDRDSAVPGTVHLALEVADLAAVHRRLHDAGVPAISRRPVRFEAPGSAWDGARCVYVRDPDGAIVELVQRDRGPRTTDHARGTDWE